MKENNSTVFDFDATDHELKLLYIGCKTREEYLLKASPKKILQDLYVLFRMREDYMLAGTIRKRLFEKVA